jgi:hypothetical protein
MSHWCRRRFKSSGLFDIVDCSIVSDILKVVQSFEMSVCVYQSVHYNNSENLGVYELKVSRI